MKILKRISRIILLLLMFNQVSGAASFKDIYNNWAKDYIQKAVDKNLLSGYPDSTFRPDKNITKVEFYTIVNKMNNYTEKSLVNYIDIKEGAWYYDEVSKAVNASYIPNLKISLMPNMEISREEVARIFSYSNSLEAGSNFRLTFKDSSIISNDCKSGVDAMVANGLISGYPDGTFKPKKGISRAEVAKIISLLYEKNLVSDSKKYTGNDYIDPNKSILKNYIEEASKINKQYYNNISYEKMLKALNEAKKVYEDKYVSVDNIDLAAKKLRAAIDGLIKNDEMDIDSGFYNENGDYIRYMQVYRISGRYAADTDRRTYFLNQDEVLDYLRWVDMIQDSDDIFLYGVIDSYGRKIYFSNGKFSSKGYYNSKGDYEGFNDIQSRFYQLYRYYSYYMRPYYENNDNIVKDKYLVRFIVYDADKNLLRPNQYTISIVDEDGNLIDADYGDYVYLKTGQYSIKVVYNGYYGEQVTQIARQTINVYNDKEVEITLKRTY